jgi:Ricin-type beta-trefoil lectin domain-like
MIIPGRYHIRLSNGRSLEAESSQFRDNGAKIQIWLLYKALNQVWDVSSAGNGQFFIRNVGGDKALDAHAPTVHNNGCKVQLWQAFDQNPNQKWMFQPVGGGYTIRCAGSNGTKVLDVKDRAIDRGGSPIQLWDAHNGDNQVWFLEPSHDRAIVSENFVDLRPNQTPIKHQGGRGSCTFFGRLAAIEAAYKKRGFGDLNLSEEFASILIKVLGLHSNWSDIRHENFREN